MVEYTGRSASPKRPRRTTTPIPLLVRVAFAALALLGAVALIEYLNPSPWLSHHPALFLRPPPPIQISSKLVPPVKGCQDVERNALEKREKAAIVLLLREQDLDELLPTLSNFEQRFNANFRYPYVLFASPDEGPFSADFRRAVLKVLPLGATVEWAVVEDQHWRIPDWLDAQEVRAGFKKQEEEGVQYAGREGYHHMIRWYSGLFAREKVLKKYDWYLRLEPGGELRHSFAIGSRADLLLGRAPVRYYCSITYDPFRFMAMKGKLYGFVITIVENMNTIPSLFTTIKSYADRKGLRPVGKALWEDFLTKRGADGKEEYTGCHHWTNMEVSACALRPLDFG